MFNPYQPMPFQQMPLGQYQQQGYEAQFLEVDGRQSIANLVIPPNQRRVYFDRNSDRFYTVSTDAVGSKTVGEYEFSEVKEEPAERYMTVDAFNEWRERFEQLVQRQIEDNAQNSGRGAHVDTRIPTAGNAPSGYQKSQP